MKTTLAGCVITLATTCASAQIYDLTVDPVVSVVDSTFGTTIANSGSLIGNHDPDTNPDGTQTIPGVFGGSGNNPIPMTLDFDVSGSDTTDPTGSMRIEIDLDNLSITLSSLTIDMLGGTNPTYPITATFEYQTFRTVNPGSLFPGGIPVDIPFGDIILSELRLDQTGDATGALAPTGPGTYTFAVAGSAELSTTTDLVGQIFESDPVPVPLALAGTLMVGDASAMVTVSLGNLDVDETIDGPIPGPQDVPFDLPTLFPPGSTANLLLSLDVDSIGFVSMLSGQIKATGTIVICPADFNNDGFVNTQDLLAFLNAYNASDPIVDLNGDGIINTSDLLAYLNIYVAGC